MGKVPKMQKRTPRNAIWDVAKLHFATSQTAFCPVLFEKFCIIILPFSCKSKEFLPKTRIFSGNVSGVSAGWTAGWRFFPMLRYHITVINDPLFFVLISRTVSWLCVRVGQIRQNVSRPFSAPLIPSTIHAHLCLFAASGLA